eukprot:gb/GECH01013192.1/.p1 GENE.gb/GECH01013192.1/~~gb/GECH01013192.1/.p1  ORF type:complete len:341 (+),score=71.54 gb/GECH01013192.1/:1-1023(+)
MDSSKDKPISPLHIVVLGAGAMGCLWGAYLALDGHRVTLVHHRSSFVDTVRRQGGVRIRSTPHDTGVIAPVSAVRSLDPSHQHHSPIHPHPIDAVLVMCKAFDTAVVARQHASLLSRASVVCTLQNGLGNVEALSPYVSSPASILYGTTVTFAQSVRNADIIGNPARPSHVWTAAPDGEVSTAMHRLVAAFNHAGLRPVSLDPGAALILWRKLAVNCSLNTVTALGRLRIGDAWDHQEGAALMLQAAREVAAVAQRSGVDLTPEMAETAVRDVAQGASKHVASMCGDVLRRRRTEVEELNGAVLREGRRYGIPTPTNDVLHALVSMVSATYDRRLSDEHE